MFAVMRLHSRMCGSSESGTGSLASWASVSDTSFSPRAGTSSASRRFWLRLGLKEGASKGKKHYKGVTLLDETFDSWGR